MRFKYIYILDYCNGKLGKFNITEDIYKYCGNDSICIEHFLEEKGFKVDQISYMLSNREYKITIIPENFVHNEKVIYREDNNAEWKFGHYNTRLYKDIEGSDFEYYVVEEPDKSVYIAPLNVNTWTLLGTCNPYIKQ